MAGLLIDILRWMRANESAGEAGRARHRELHDHGRRRTGEERPAGLLGVPQQVLVVGESDELKGKGVHTAFWGCGTAASRALTAVRARCRPWALRV
ncbi:replicative DNA helicase protein [Deinococcus grandis]|uniref:Replicative DNA helicase protein n=1 Tax=Deinococcus grandis TaxID=57498 RepID=A0A100HN59_9DEIO|nr:replicative DNA helicase protein [Deinococcus grandis]